VPGVELGRRHDPLGAPFLNGPTTGKDVFVPVDFIIGGPKMAGQGWLMLMQCLSAGRGISLPSLSAGATQLATRTLGAYTTVREQFNLPLGKFEGVQEAIARVAGYTYALDALRRVTAAAVDQGEKPSVVSAIAKAYSTETMRSALNDTMDVLGGSGISLGPKNIMASACVQAPIGITVEGANILTRTMIIFGQGALRCHPYARFEVEAVAKKDTGEFDRLFFKHIGFVFQNMARSWVLGVTGARFVPTPNQGPLAGYFQQLTRMSAAFTTCADFAMGTLGGQLKRKEQLTGKLADAFAWLYIASTVLKRFHDEGQNREHVPYARWALDRSLYNTQQALDHYLMNLPNRLAALKLRAVCFPLGRRYSPPKDTLNVTIAEGVLENGSAREWLTHAIFVPPRNEPGLGRLEDALEKVMAARPIQKAVRAAVKAKKLPARPSETLYDRALGAGVITEEQHRQAMEAEAARLEVVTVDSFSEFSGNFGTRKVQNEPEEQATTSSTR
jgi:acyl-CoA dehydrogenase